MRFLTLIEAEIKKIIPLLIGILSLGLIGHSAIFTLEAVRANKQIQASAVKAGQTLQEYFATAEKISISSVAKMSTLMFVLAAFLIFTLIAFMWYKEWFGQSKRIYMLLTMRGSRFNIFSSKLVTFLLCCISMVTMIFLALFADYAILSIIFPKEALIDNMIPSAILNTMLLGIVMPTSLFNLLTKILFATMVFSTGSAIILMDRSKKIFGMIAGIFYGIALCTAYGYMKSLYLYTVERIMVELIFVIAVSALGILISQFLLKKKVSI